MAVLADLSEAERYLVALLLDPSGIDPAEFLWADPTSPDGCFRLWDYQYTWYRDESTHQIDQSARAVGKSLGIQMRASTFGFRSPGEELLLTAPEMIHLEPVTEKVEDRILSVRLTREMLKPSSNGNGITHRPFEARFRNGAKILGRIPQKDGRGIKGSVIGGSLVLGPAGLVPVEKVEPGDLVFTHRQRFRPVLHVHSYEADTVAVAGGGHRRLVVSANHRFYGRRNRNPQRTRNLADPTWLPVDDEEVTERWYWASPTSFPRISLPTLPREVVEPGTFLWLCGRYVADGTASGHDSTGARTNVAVVDSLDQIRAFELAAEVAGYQPRRRPHDNAHCTAIYNKELTKFLLENFGHRAEGKFLPTWLLGAARPLREAFLDGYLTGDGHYDEQREKWTASSASKELALGLKLLGQSLGYSAGFSWVDPKVTRIGGVESRKEPQRAFRVTFTPLGRGNAIEEDGLAWQRIRKVEPTEPAMVYDLVVAEDYSYVADGIVHKGSSVLPWGED